MKKKIFATGIDNSFLMGIADNIPVEIEDKKIIELLKGNKEFSDIKVIDGYYEDVENQRFHHYELKYRGNIYEFVVRVYSNFNYVYTSVFPRSQYLNKEDKKALENADRVLEVMTLFDGDADEHYKLQLKILATLLPDFRAMLDVSSASIFNKHWVKGIIEGKIELKNSDKFHVNGEIFQRDGKARITSNGLMRLGLRDVQIICDVENVDRCRILMEDVVSKLVSQDINTFNEGEKLTKYLWSDICLVETDDLKAQCNNGLDNYLDIKGYVDDDTYISLEDIENFECIPEMYFVPEDKSIEMNKKVFEHFSTFEKFYKESYGIIKCAIPFDLDFNNLDFLNSEYIWFEDVKIKENGDFEARSLNTSINLEESKAINKGDIVHIPRKALVDWQIKLDDQYIPSDEWIILEGEKSEYSKERKGTTGKVEKNKGFFAKLKGLFSR